MRSLVFLFFLVASLWAFTMDYRDDYRTFAVSTSQGIDADSLLEGSGSTLESYWFYTTLPAPSVAGRSLYLALEGELFHRDISFNNYENRRSLYQRYGFFAGYPLLKNGTQSGTLFAGVGVASDFSSLSKRDLYWQLIYDHRIVLSNDLTVGLGILYSYLHGAPKRTFAINILPTLRWRVHDRVKLSVNWDNIECKLYVKSRVAFVAEGRYDLSWYDLAKVSYLNETVSAGGGLDVKLGSDLYMRGRVLKNLYQREILWDDNSEWIVPSKGGSGLTLRVMLTYVR